MNIYLISEYVSRLRKSDIIYYAEKQGISLDKEEVELIYNYIKKDYKTIIYGNPKDILNEIKFKVKPLTYNKIENLYIKSLSKVLFFIISISYLYGGYTFSLLLSSLVTYGVSSILGILSNLSL